MFQGFFCNFYGFYFWLCVFHVLHYQFFIVIFPKSIVISLIADFFNSFFLFFGSFTSASSFFSFFLALLFWFLFLFLIFLCLIEQCKPVFYQFQKNIKTLWIRINTVKEFEIRMFFYFCLSFVLFVLISVSVSFFVNFYSKFILRKIHVGS